jgi:hypothetical protein
MRMNAGAGAIISWEPDCSPQVMTVITISLEAFINKDRDNCQLGLTFGSPAVGLRVQNFSFSNSKKNH